MSENNSWWSISTEEILAMLREVADGADPDLVLTEHYANAEQSD